MDSTDRESEIGNHWVVYIIGCDDGRFYTGVTSNLARRWREHSGLPQGAKFFRGRKPAQLLYVETDHDRSSALRREAAIKRLRRVEKERLLTTVSNRLGEKDWLQVY